MATNTTTNLRAAVARGLGVTRQRVSQRVNKLRERLPMSIDEALGILGHEAGISVSDYLDPGTVARVRDLITQLEGVPEARQRHLARREAVSSAQDEVEVVRLRRELKEIQRQTPFVIRDRVLSERCLDLLNARNGWDRAVNQAVLVLEDRVRTAGGYTDTDYGKDLMQKAFAVGGPFKLSTVPQEQESARLMLMGLYGFLRNPTGHRLGHKTNKQDAASVVMFVDYLLQLLK